jgi:hypothetical protein
MARNRNFSGISNLGQQQWNKENAKDIRIVLTQAQLNSGLTDPILEETKTSTPPLEVGLI